MICIPLILSLICCEKSYFLSKTIPATVKFCFPLLWLLLYMFIDDKGTYLIMQVKFINHSSCFDLLLVVDSIVICDVFSLPIRFLVVPIVTF